MAEYIITLDIGTTSTKGYSFLSNGQSLASHQRFYPTHYPFSGFAEQDPVLILKAVEEVLRVVILESRDHQLIGICFSAAMHSILAVDKNYTPLSPLLIWADARSHQQAHELKHSELGAVIFKETGTPVHPMSPLCKIKWWKDHDPALFAKAHRFISMKEFVIQQLTGHEVVDYSVASATGLFHQNRLTWSMAALNWIGLSEERLFQPVSSHTILHTTKQSIVPDVPWIIGASDGCLAHWGSGANKNDISFTLGTSGAVRRFNPQNKIVGSGEVFSYKLDEHVTISGGASNCGTAIIDWYAKNMRQTSSSVQSLVDEIKTIPAGVDGLVALPMLMGERAPVYNSNARGVFFGVSMQQTHLHFQRALFEGICYEMKSIVEAVESNLGPSDKIIISGGFTHSPYWMQMMSDVLNRTLTLTDERDASSLGAAKFGFESLGLKWEKETAYHEQIHPQASHVNIYHANYQLFRTLYEQLEVLFTPPQFP